MVRETLGGFELPENLTENIMQWIQMNEPGVAASIGTLSKTSDGTIYAVMGYKNIYKLTPEKDEWQPVNSEFFPDKTEGSIPITEHNGTLYVIPSQEMFTSNDGGITWDSAGICPEGHALELVVSDDTFYLTQLNGIYRSGDAGKSWQDMHDGLDKRIIEKSTVGPLRLTQDTLFLGTYLGMYRNRSGTWEYLQLPVDNIVRVCSLEVTEEHIYVAAEVNILEGDGTPTENYFNLCDANKECWWVFRSADGGHSWTDITPKDARKLLKTLPPIRLIAHENTLILVGIEEGIVTRSIDCGDTWETIEHSGITPMKFSVNDAVALDTDCSTGTFYTGGLAGIHRSTDGGKTWHRFNTKFPCRVDNLMGLKTSPDSALSNILFATVAGTLVRSTDAGNSWTTVDIELPKYTETVPKYNAKVKGRDYTPRIVQISVANGELYAKGIRRNSETAFYRLDPDKNCLSPVEGYIFELGKTPPSRDSARLMWTVFGNATFPFQSDRLSGQGIQITFTRSTDPDADTESLSTQVIRNDPKYGAQSFLKLLDVDQSDQQTTHELMWEGLFGNFAVSDKTYFMEYNYKLFRWNPGDTRWSDTGVEETCKLTPENVARGFKIAASGETVYVGKRDGQLFQSLDGGENWNDITSKLPKSIEHFNQIVLTNTTVYVATDKGVFNSIDGVVWNRITDKKGKELTIKSLATVEDTVYGANDDGIYQYENKKGIWKQIVPQMPDTITSLVVDGETFFVGTEQRGVHRFERSEAQ